MQKTKPPMNGIFTPNIGGFIFLSDFLKTTH